MTLVRKDTLSAICWEVSIIGAQICEVSLTYGPWTEHRAAHVAHLTTIVFPST